MFTGWLLSGYSQRRRSANSVNALVREQDADTEINLNNNLPLCPNVGKGVLCMYMSFLQLLHDLLRDVDAAGGGMGEGMGDA